MQMVRVRPLLLLMVWAVAAVQAGRAGDWPGWRGPDRDGVVPNFSPPAEWPAELRLEWRASVGRGHSSPVVAGDRVYFHAREGDEEVVWSFDLESGERLWRQSYPAKYKTALGSGRHGKGPKSTPAIAEDRLYTLGITGVLTAWDAPSGELLWRKDYAETFAKTWPRFGTATSPLIDGGRLIVHLGGHDDGALIAFAAESGEELWRWSKEGPAYASPIVAELGGGRQVVTQTEDAVVGVEVESGLLLWRFPFAQNSFRQNIVTPALYRDAVIVSGEKRGTYAVRPVEEGGVWSTRTLWHNEENSMHMSSPVVRGDLVFGLSHRDKGRLFCLDARTGKTLWTTGPRTAENAALLAIPGALVVLTDGAELLVVEETAERFRALARYTVADSPTWAHPVILASHQILIKDGEALSLWSLGE